MSESDAHLFLDESDEEESDSECGSDEDSEEVSDQDDERGPQENGKH